MIKVYHSDNGIFNASYFMEELLKKQQKIRFSGSGASHQNGAAECTVNAVVTMPRTILIHVTLRYPENTFSTDICTMEMDCSVWIYNRISDMQSGLSAIGIWSMSSFETVSETLSKCNVCGYPTYVLEQKLQKHGVNIPK